MRDGLARWAAGIAIVLWGFTGVARAESVSATATVLIIIPEPVPVASEPLRPGLPASLARDPQVSSTVTFDGGRELVHYTKFLH